MLLKEADDIFLANLGMNIQSWCFNSQKYTYFSREVSTQAV